MAANNAGHRLLGVWKNLYQQRHGETYVGSKYRDASMLKGVAEDIGEADLREIMEWYFERKSRHDFTKFIFEYDKLAREMHAQRRDAKKRERLREHTRKRMQEEGIDL